MEKTEIQSKSRNALSRSIKTRKRRRSDSNDGNDPQKIQKQAAACDVSNANAVCSAIEPIKEETERIQFLNEEQAAIRLTKSSKEDCLQNRRLTAFTVHDKYGQLQPIDMVEESNLYISALILPLEDTHDDEKEIKIRIEEFGPIISWSLSGYDDNSPIIWISTQAADYECLKPSRVYQEQYRLFYLKACACIDVYRALSTCCGGNPGIGFNDLVAAVSQSWAEKSNIIPEPFTKDLLISWGRFIHDQLVGLDESSLKGDTIFTNLPVLLALRDASDKEKTKSRRRQHPVSTKYDISDDYPPPAYYKRSIEEMDECTMFKVESDDDSDELPQHLLHDWCLYRLDGRFISLELLAEKPFDVKDRKICFSGVVETDQGNSFSCANDSSPSSSFLKTDGVPVHLSEIKEWIIKWRSSMVSISIQTDIAWYTLGNPSAEYNPWYEPVLKVVTFAVSIITLLKEQRRASRLSFREVIEKVSGFSEDHPSYISSDSAAVERYMLVHGQFILQLFENYPDVSIRKCAFVRGLGDYLKELHHIKKMKKKALRKKEETLPSEAVMQQSEVMETKAMPATTTKLVHRLWGEYCSNYFSKDSADKDAKEWEHKRVPLGVNVEKFHSITRRRKSRNASTIVRWAGGKIGRISSGEVFYKQAMVDGVSIHVGSSVLVETVDSKDDPPIFFLEYLFEDFGAKKSAHGRLMLRGHQTVLGHSSNTRELFLTNHCVEFELYHVRGIVSVEIQSTLWGHQHRNKNADADSNDRARAEERKNKKFPHEFFCRKLYCPEKGAFLCLKTDSMGLGNGHCPSCKIKESHNSVFFKLSRSHFTFKGIKYHIHDFLYVHQDHVKSHGTNKGNPKSRKKVGLKPFVVCQLLEIENHEPFEIADPESTILSLQRFFRPEDISADQAYHSDIQEIYFSEQEIKVPVVAVQGKCELREKEEMHHFPTTYVYQHIFYCEELYDQLSGSLEKLSSEAKCSLLRKEPVKAAVNRRISRKRKNAERVLNVSNQEHSDQRIDLATLDIFAGCGGLSLGLEQSGVSTTKWAIEYEQPTGEAFKLNHPEAKIFVRNCNVILRAIMADCGDADDCISTPEATALAARLDPKEINDLPRPGDVDFIIGGPPCQGFSKMNRYNQSSWSKVQCEMILAFLSFADYFRPKFFLLENVRNFIFFNKGQVFRFTLAALLEMGYQVRFGILEAGAFGVSQNRRRAFIWAASPEENLPEWPEPMFVFKGSELKIPLGGNIHYAAVPRTENGAPFRAITIRDTIGDLPTVKNGASKPTMEYKKEPISWFQRQIRGDMKRLNDHISKNMTELNLLRCRKVPKRPGADWHDIPDIKVVVSSGKVADLLPPWLHKTAARNNNWKGLYGRLDWAGKFPTCVTDPQPMGKVGRWFHPKQDRIVTVREYARAQGFPDSYQFAGSIHHKHKQVGNAVPPPLAFALGRKLKEAIEKNKRSNSS